MVPVALSDVIAVGEVPTAEQIEILAKAGFRAIINTQPDGEVARLMASADARLLAEKAGLSFRHLPVPSRRPTEETVQAFAEALAALPRPIYACCYSGARTAAVWALAAAAHQEPDTIVAACATAGFDIGFLKPALADRRARATAAPVSGPALGHANGHANGPGSKPADPVPTLKPSILIPRAATAGGFAVAG